MHTHIESAVLFFERPGHWSVSVNASKKKWARRGRGKRYTDTPVMRWWVVCITQHSLSNHVHGIDGFDSFLRQGVPSSILFAAFTSDCSCFWRDISNKQGKLFNVDIQAETLCTSSKEDFSTLKLGTIAKLWTVISILFPTCDFNPFLF